MKLTLDEKLAKIFRTKRSFITYMLKKSQKKVSKSIENSSTQLESLIKSFDELNNKRDELESEIQRCKEDLKEAIEVLADLPPNASETQLRDVARRQHELESLLSVKQEEYRKNDSTLELVTKSIRHSKFEYEKLEAKLTGIQAQMESVKIMDKATLTVSTLESPMIEERIGLAHSISTVLNESSARQLENTLSSSKSFNEGNERINQIITQGNNKEVTT